MFSNIAGNNFHGANNNIDFVRGEFGFPTDKHRSRCHVASICAKRFLAPRRRSPQILKMNLRHSISDFVFCAIFIDIFAIFLSSFLFRLILVYFDCKPDRGISGSTGIGRYIQKVLNVFLENGKSRKGSETWKIQCDWQRLQLRRIIQNLVAGGHAVLERETPLAMLRSIVSGGDGECADTCNPGSRWSP